MTPARDIRPEVTFDEALYEPLPGSEPMGPPPEDWEVSLLEMEFPSPDARLDANDLTPRNFHDRHERALELLEKTRDLRVYVRLCEALSHLEGPTGLHGGLHLVNAVTRSFWDTIHPGPPDDPRARNGRLRAFGPLRDRKFITALDPHVVFNAGGFEGEITLRHFCFAAEGHATKKSRRVPQEGEPAYTFDSLQKVVAKAEAGDAVEATLTALRGSAELLRELQAFLTEMPEYQRLNFGGAVEELAHYIAALEAFGGTPSTDQPAQPAVPEGTDAVAPAEEATTPSPAPAASLNSREEARALLDAVIGYYAAEARSSPIPLVLLKIRDMSDATFTDWLAAVAAEGSEKAAVAINGVDTARLDEFMPAETEAQTNSPATPPAIAALDDALAALSANEAAATAAPEEIERLSAAVAEARAALADSAAPNAQSARAASTIRDRVAVREALQRLAVYYRTAEPSSPASVCFERLIPLVDRPFMDIVRELAPGGNQAALRLAPTERGEKPK